MHHAYLAPFWQIMFGLSMALFALCAFKWRSALYARGHYLPLVALFLFPFGFFLLSASVSGGLDATLKRATPLLMAGSGVLFLAAVVLVLAISKLARDGAGQGA